MNGKILQLRVNGFNLLIIWLQVPAASVSGRVHFLFGGGGWRVGDEKMDLFSLLRAFFQSNSIGLRGRSGGIFVRLDCCFDFKQ